MGSHKHGVYSFSVRIERIKMISGDEFVAEVTKLRRHGPTGAATDLDTPELGERYGQTASEAEGFAVSAMRAWLSC